MKKAFLILVPVLLLGGCASLWRTMGVATLADEAAREEVADQRLAELRGLVDKLAAEAEETKAAAGRVAALEDSVAELAAAVESAQRAGVEIEEIKLRLEALPDETLRRLAELLNAALESQ